MHHRTKRACAAAVAAAAATALAAGATGPASADQVTAGAAGLTGLSGQAGLSGQKERYGITLVTGDRVSVDAKGRPTGFAPAEGRERIPVRIHTAKGHTLLLPADAQRLTAAGKVDQRLFDVTELSKKRHREAQRKGLKLIVGYKGASSNRAARAEVRAAGDTTVRRSLKTLNADAVTTPRRDAGALWRAVARGRGGIGHLWLDGTRRVTLDKSVRRIGAPKAWQAGYDGKGVKITVLDGGVDGTHPDLKGQVVAEKNFSTAPDAKDHYGHGTHVASIAAGTGAKSGGRFKGVAPGAKVLSGKVVDDQGSGDDSGIIAGMEWAAAQGADIVNLSLGDDDTPGVGPLEAAVNRLSKDKGVLFTISAGNDGAAHTIGSPGSADEALTIGAVDGKDKLADFSSQGPRDDGGVIKPDVTAPGVGITAAAVPGSALDKEYGQKPEGYLTLDGTSMAAPHVAGSAALLKQRHPDWTSAQLKGVLVASTKGGKYTPYQQGSGRIAADRAIEQTVIADPVSLDLGVQRWPHADDKPVTRKVTYRNLGTKDVTLDLSVKGTDPEGRPAPTGFFSLGARKVTVPAGGAAAVDLVADTRPGGTGSGVYSAYVVASGGGQSVRTAAVVDREVESYDVTLKHIGRDGRPATSYGTYLSGAGGPAAGHEFGPFGESATVTVRAPKGRYVLDAQLAVDPQDAAKGLDWVAAPGLMVTKDRTLTLDARTTKPVDITVPDRDARQRLARPSYTVVAADGGEIANAWTLPSFGSLRSAHLGPRVTDGTLYQTWSGVWTKGGDEQYAIGLGGRTERVATGWTRHLSARDFATVRSRFGASARGRTGVFGAEVELPGGVGPSGGWQAQQPVPGVRTFRLSTVDGARWDMGVVQLGADEEGNPAKEVEYEFPKPRRFEPGRTYEQTFNVGVFGPLVGSGYGIYRDGNELSGRLPLFADGKGNIGSSDHTSARTTLYRNGTRIGTNKDPLTGEESFKVPAADATYRLTTSVKRGPEIAAVSPRVDASWTFRSKKTSGETRLPASTVRFAPKLDLSSRAPAGARQSVPVTVRGPAAGAGLKSLAVSVSYDGGRTWKNTPVARGKVNKVTVKNPAKGKAISFRAEVADKKGNTSTLTVRDAYYGK